MYLFIYLSIFWLSIHISINISINLSVYLCIFTYYSITQRIYLFINPFIFLSQDLPVFSFSFLSTYLSISLSPFTFWSITQSIYPSVSHCLSVYHIIDLFANLSIHRSVCLCLSVSRTILLSICFSVYLGYFTAYRLHSFDLSFHLPSRFRT